MEMGSAVGTLVIVTGATLVLAAAGWVRPRSPHVVSVLLLAVGGAAVGAGGLLFVDDPGVAAWILTPPALALIAVLHVEVLSAGSGPLRT